ncbi:MAG: hypothetical protein CMO16_07355 [Thaumarchaeota archaeon]|nr:hypothetical protein [Nitrososphaerota archaeon]
MKKRNKIGMTLLLSVSLLVPSIASADSILGPLLGGVIGSTIGKGRGRLGAIIGGIIIGSVIENDIRHRNRRSTVRMHPHYNGPFYLPPPRFPECAGYLTIGERRACHRGVERRQNEVQRQRESYAYKNGYNGGRN